MAIKGVPKVPGRIKRGEPIFQPEVKARKASPEFAEKAAKRVLESAEKGARKDQIWTSERKGFEEVKIVKERENAKGNEVMLIYNKKLSVSPLTTHIPLAEVSKRITKLIIIKKFTMKILINFLF